MHTCTFLLDTSSDNVRSLTQHLNCDHITRQHICVKVPQREYSTSVSHEITEYTDITKYYDAVNYLKTPRQCLILKYEIAINISIQIQCSAWIEENKSNHMIVHFPWTISPPPQVISPPNHPYHGKHFQVWFGGYAQGRCPGGGLSGELVWGERSG